MGRLAKVCTKKCPIDESLKDVLAEGGRVLGGSGCADAELFSHPN